jgi:thiol-disulfide isomerase/thioredoxin
MSSSVQRLAIGLLLAAGLLIVGVGQSHAGGDWNDTGVKWRPYEEGLATAKKEKKPICLIFFTEWCPHCQNYSAAFHDPKVVERSKQFVMIRLDKDKNAELSKKYAPDGEYIPRTYFLTSAGTLEPAIHAPRQNYQYFYDEKDPAGILAGMDDALKKLK